MIVSYLVLLTYSIYPTCQRTSVVWKFLRIYSLTLALSFARMSTL